MIEMIRRTYEMRSLRRALVAAVLLFSLCTGAFAQLDGGWHVIRQNGKIVGEIFVPMRPADAKLYVEHWVLYEDYIYPSPTNRATIEISPEAAQIYRDEADFFAHVRFAPVAATSR